MFAKALPPLLLAGLSACTSSPDPVPGAPPDALQHARELIASGAYEQALDQLEPLTERYPTDGASQLLLAQAYLGFARQRLAQHKANAPLLLGDADRLFDRAATLVKDERPWIGRARVHLLQGDPLGAREYIARALGILRTEPPSADELQIQLLRARISLAVLKSMEVGAKPALEKELEEEVQSALRTAQARDAAEVEIYRLWVALHLHFQRFDAAAEVLGEALREHRDLDGLHTELQKLYLGRQRFDELVAVYEELDQEHRDPKVSWYRALAYLMSADHHRASDEDPAALEAYGRAARIFQDVEQASSAFAETSSYYRAMALAGCGWCRYNQGDLEGAQGEFSAAIEERPDLAQTPDSANRTARLGIDYIAAAYVKQGQTQKARELLERVVKHLPEIPAWLNNLGLLCRDSATAALQAGRTEEARKLFQRSFDYYTRCTLLVHSDPRLINDRALVIVYHLVPYLKPQEREKMLAHATEELMRAVDLGEKALAALDAGEQPEFDPPVQDKRDFFLEATGDALSNLGYLYLKIRQDPTKAKGYFERCLKLDPERPRNRQVRWYLEQIEKGVKEDER